MLLAGMLGQISLTAQHSSNRRHPDITPWTPGTNTMAREAWALHFRSDKTADPLYVLIRGVAPAQMPLLGDVLLQCWLARDILPRGNARRDERWLL